MNSFNVEVKLYFAIKTKVQVKVTMRETIMRYLAGGAFGRSVFFPRLLTLKGISKFLPTTFLLNDLPLQRSSLNC